jgi:hypothetical protein
VIRVATDAFAQREEAMIELNIPHPTIYYPEELKMLTRICKVVRRERGIDVKSDGAKEIADRALELYSSGITDDATLLQMLRLRA